MGNDAVFRYPPPSPDKVPCGQRTTLTIVVANETGASHDCTEIRFAFPDGLDTSGVSASVRPPASWSLAPDPGGAEGTFVAAPVPPATGLGVGERLGLVFAGVGPWNPPATRPDGKNGASRRSAPAINHNERSGLKS
jgi:hypothetical protein